MNLADWANIDHVFEPDTQEIVKYLDTFVPIPSKIDSDSLLKTYYGDNYIIENPKLRKLGNKWMIK